MKAFVVYESLWGNTAAIARAIADGLGPGAVALTTDEAGAETVENADLIVAGTGGATPGEFGATAPNSEVQHTGTWGALRLRLASDQYSWTFERAAGSAFTDSGTGSCH